MVRNIAEHIQTRLSQHYNYDIKVDGDIGPKTLDAILDVLQGSNENGKGVIYNIQAELNDHLDAGLKLDDSIGSRRNWDKSKTLAAVLTMLGGPVELPEPDIDDLVEGSARFVDKIVLHCSATPEGREVSSETIASWHKARGFSGRGGTYVGYHYLIHLDGTVEVCKPEGVRGTHAYPYNTASIGICYIGGVEKDGKTPKDTRTPEQLVSMELLIRAVLEDYPTITQIMGHRDVPGVAKACPCFDVKEWLEEVGIGT